MKPQFRHSNLSYKILSLGLLLFDIIVDLDFDMKNFFFDILFYVNNVAVFFVDMGKNRINLCSTEHKLTFNILLSKITSKQSEQNL